MPHLLGQNVDNLKPLKSALWSLIAYKKIYYWISRGAIRLPGQVWRPRAENQVHVPTIQDMNDHEYHPRQRQTEYHTENSHSIDSIEYIEPLAGQEQVDTNQSSESNERSSAGFVVETKMDCNEPHDLPGSLHYDGS